MKREEQIRMLLHPEQHTDEQIDSMFSEADVPAADAEAAWQRFLTATQGRRRRSRLRVAAAVIGVLMLSGIAYATVMMLRSPKVYVEKTAPATAVVTPVTTAPRAVDAEEAPAADSVRLFSNVPLDETVRQLAGYYNKVADIRAAGANDVRLYYKWRLSDSLESVVRDLNHFDKVNLTVEDGKLIVK